MKEEIKEIKPGTGLGLLKFGLTRNEAKKILGEPTEIEKFSYTDSEEDLTEYWHYDDLELSISFDEEYDWKLSTISISSDEYVLKGKKLIGMDIDQLLETLNELSIKTELLEDLSDDDTLMGKLLVNSDQTISFFLENDILTEIQLEPVIVDDEAVIWPE